MLFWSLQEAPAIYAANCAVVFLMAAVLFFVIVGYMPDPKPKAAKPKAGKGGAQKRDGKYTRQEVAQHSTQACALPVDLLTGLDPCHLPLNSGVSTVTQDDCWVIIKDRVFDVTPYVEEHPGGLSILRNAG